LSVSKADILDLIKRYWLPFLFVVVYLLGVVFLILQYRSLKEQEWILKKAAKRYSRFIKRNKNLKKKELEFLKIVKKLEENSVKADTEAIALTKLQNIVAKKAESCGLNVNVVRSMRSRRIEGSWYTIAVRLDFSGTSKSLINFLYSLESSEKPYIFIDELDISVVSFYKGKEKTKEIRGFIVAKSFWHRPSS